MRLLQIQKGAAVNPAHISVVRTDGIKTFVVMDNGLEYVVVRPDIGNTFQIYTWIVDVLAGNH